MNQIETENLSQNQTKSNGCPPICRHGGGCVFIFLRKRINIFFIQGTSNNVGNFLTSKIVFEIDKIF